MKIQSVIIFDFSFLLYSHTCTALTNTKSSYALPRQRIFKAIAIYYNLASCFGHVPKLTRKLQCTNSREYWRIWLWIDFLYQIWNIEITENDTKSNFNSVLKIVRSWSRNSTYIHIQLDGGLVCKMKFCINFIYFILMQFSNKAVFIFQNLGDTCKSSTTYSRADKIRILNVTYLSCKIFLHDKSGPRAKFFLTSPLWIREWRIGTYSPLVWVFVGIASI
jgi:hypothetical protein